MAIITPQDCWIGWLRETTNCQGSGYRDDSAAISGSLNPLDVWEEGVEFPLTVPEYTEIRAGGSRDPTHLVLNKYAVGDGSISSMVQLAYWWYYAMGDCTTTGASSPYTHSIEAENTLPSLKFHVRQGSSHKTDHYGCVAKSLTFSLEKDGPAKHELGLMVAKSKDQDGSTLTAPSFLSQETVPPYTWSHIDTSSLSFSIGGNPVFNDSGDVLSQYLESISISVENTLELHTPGGDKWGGCAVIGDRTFKVAMHVKLIDDTLFNLAQEEYPYSAGDLDFTFRVARAVDDYIEWTFDKLRISSYSPYRVPSTSDMYLGVDIEMTLGAGATLPTVVEQNAYDNTRYEGSP